MAAISGEPISVSWLLDLFFPRQRPQDQEAALKAVFAFVRCGEEECKNQTRSDPTYAFSADGGTIYAAFLEVYQIDLHTAELHWWHFMALLRGLLEISFAERVQARTVDIGKIKDRDAKMRMRRLQELYALDRHGRRLKAPTTVEEYEALMLAQARGEA